MADIAAADVTYTVQRTSKQEDSRRQSIVKIAFGNGSLTYPSGGIPLSGLSAAGFPNLIESVNLIDANDGSGIVWKYDYENKKLRGYIAPAQTHDHDLKIVGGGTIVADGDLGISASDQLVKVEATDATIAGADSATKGGVLSEALAAAAMTELTGAVAAQTLYANVIGY